MQPCLLQVLLSKDLLDFSFEYLAEIVDVHPEICQICLRFALAEVLSDHTQ